MQRLLLFFFALLAAMTPLSGANAQWSNGFHATVQGEGRFSLSPGTDFDVRRVKVDLERGGSVNITVFGQGNSVSLTGRWSGGKDDEPQVSFRRYEGRAASITGAIEFSSKDGRLERVTFSGNSGSTRLSLKFDGKSTSSGGIGGGNGNGSGNTDDDLERLNVRASGNGTLTIGNNNQRIDAVRVALKKNNSATLTLYLPGREETLQGRWGGKGQYLSVQFDNGLNGRLASARGTINRRLRTGGVDALTINGYQGQRAVRIAFRAD